LKIKLKTTKENNNNNKPESRFKFVWSKKKQRGLEKVKADYRLGNYLHNNH